ncbi:Scramblase-domain-containing protein [Mytilinidion resinicola]|uniref:Scramblase-domain-containing protein n=1 Tax=Mytilinidion resinicola TaxID=574789 RepID=A0A6A6Z7H7_9PEZI|nr:Scramblase-domain-containing protein [Mytilinidion resinicola]KAF2816669.1 Scramblase-domain-containing protein [Mytilinidion resinicola]
MFLTTRWSLRLPRLIYRPLSTSNRPRGRPLKNSLNKSPPSQFVRSQKQPQEPVPAQPSSDPSKIEAVSTALSQASDADNNLLTPVHIPEDPHGVLKENHPAVSLLHNSSIIVQRQIEMMNVFLGFEQANRYVIMDPHGNHIGYLAEQEHGMGNAIARQMLRTHRSFTTHVFDKHEQEVLRFHRPFSWISSRIRVYDAQNDTESYSPSTSLQGTSVGSIASQTSSHISSIPLSQMRIIGSAEQEWAPLRRKYNLFLARNLNQTQPDPNLPQLTSGDLPLSNSKALQVVEGDSRETGMMQFARVDEPFLSWDFTLLSEDQRLLGSVNRNFAGFAREIFTDTGVYALRMDAAGLASEPSHIISKTSARHKEDIQLTPGMTLDQRAVMLATAVSIDFDYFSRHSSQTGGMGFMPLWFPMGGGEAAGGAAAGGAAEAGAVGAGTAEAGTAMGEVGSVARGVGSGEGAIAGAGTMAGYEAMQRGRGSSPQPNEEESKGDPFGAGGDPRDGDSPWASDEDSHWFGDDSPGSSSGPEDGGSNLSSGSQGPQGGDGGGGEGGGWMDSFGDFFGGD